MFLHVSVILFTCMLGYTPPPRDQRQTPSGTKGILLECILVLIYFYIRKGTIESSFLGYVTIIAMIFVLQLLYTVLTYLYIQTKHRDTCLP